MIAWPSRTDCHPAFSHPRESGDLVIFKPQRTPRALRNNKTNSQYLILPLLKSSFSLLIVVIAVSVVVKKSKSPRRQSIPFHRHPGESRPHTMNPVCNLSIDLIAALCFRCARCGSIRP
jgi:hypothetical protein